MKSIYAFIIAIIFSVIAINLFVYIETLFFGVISIFLSMIFVEYGISKRVFEERHSEKNKYILIKIGELALKLSKAKNKKIYWEEYKNLLKNSCSIEKIKKIISVKFKKFIYNKKISDRAKRMYKNGANKEIIGKEILKMFNK